MTDSREVEVTQADRDFAADNLTGPMTQCIRDGGLDSYPLVRNAARHRLAATERIAVLDAALRAIVEGDYPRTIDRKWRKDGAPSKHDACPHGKLFYEDCGDCISDFAQQALSGPAG